MEVRTLNAKSPDLAEWLPELLRLAREVFEPEIFAVDQDIPSNAPQLQIGTWNEKLALPDSAFFYVLDEFTGTTDAKLPGKISGFFFAHSRLLLENLGLSARSTYHIYIAAVHPTARSRGIFPLLLGATREFARAAGYQRLTVATIPDKFPRMYSILSKDGSGWFLLEEKELVDEDGVSQKKILMQMFLEQGNVGL